MKEEWKIHAKRADFKALSEKYNIDQVAARVMVNRGIEDLSTLMTLICLKGQWKLQIFLRMQLKKKST